MSEQLLPLPFADPEQGYTKPDLSFAEQIGAQPQSEIDWAEARDTERQQDAEAVANHEHAIAVARQEQALDPLTLRFSSMYPTWCGLGDAMFYLRVFGSPFTPTTKILWNNGEEFSDFISENEIGTWVDPSTASGPVSVPVTVREISVGNEQEGQGVGWFTFRTDSHGL